MMGPSPRHSRRLVLLVPLPFVTAACSSISLFAAKNRANRTPRQTLDDYFTFVTSDHYDQAQTLLSTSFQAKLGKRGVDNLLHAFESVHVTNLINAVSWANELGAHLPNPASNRREYLVTLDVKPSTLGARDWPKGTARRFVDLVWQDNMWKIDAIGTSPGQLITGTRPLRATNEPMLIVPSSPLRIGPAPIDRAIYTARQNAADRGQLAWATDPIQVVHRDGPSFGINSGDRATLNQRDVDPVTLTPRCTVIVEHGGEPLLVTLIQPIRRGPGGVWAISNIRLATLTHS